MRQMAVPCLSGLLFAATAFGRPDAVGSMRPCPAPPDLKASDCLGSAVVADGDQVMASARGRDAGGNRSGGVARWTREERAWIFDTWIDSPRPAAGQEFGQALSLKGSTLVVGAPLDSYRGSNSGSAWVLAPAASNAWTAKADLVPSTPEPGERFGMTVATNGQRVVVSAPHATVGGASRAGRVLVYEPSGSNFASPVILTAPTPVADALFGESLACDGSWVIVGCPSDDGASPNSGSVLAFRKTPVGWVLSQQIGPPAASPEARFGQSLALEGNRLWISEPRSSAGGSVHLYTYSGSRFNLVGTVNAPPFSEEPEFGWSVAASGTRMMVGAPRRVVNGVSSGVAMLVEAATVPVQMSAEIMPLSPGDVDLTSTAVAIKDSVMAFGAPGRSECAFASGAVYAADLQFDCDTDGVPDALSIARGDGDQDGDGLPNACDCIGDLDGDRLVSTADLSLLLLDFDSTGWPLPADLDENGFVDTGDLALLLLYFDPCP
jgi:hypothetical protein